MKIYLEQELFNLDNNCSFFNNNCSFFNNNCFWTITINFLTMVVIFLTICVFEQPVLECTLYENQSRWQKMVKKLTIVLQSGHILNNNRSIWTMIGKFY